METGVRTQSRKLGQAERRVLRRAFIAIVLLGVLFLLFAPGRGWFSYRSLKKELAQMEQEKERLAQENIELQKEIDKLQNDPAYLEEIARHKYGLVKEDEKIFDFSRGRKETKKKEK